MLVGGYMKKKDLFIFAFCLICLLIPNMVSAHPGKTDSSGCHVCRTNCEKWGLSQDERHCHNGNTYTNSKGQTFNSDGSMTDDSSSQNNSDYSTIIDNNTNNSNTNNNNANNNSNNNTNNNSNKQPSVPTEPSKSSDNTLKLITIDGENIEIADQMNYKTKNEEIEIFVVTNDSKATYTINNNSLSVGINTVEIQVTAENGDVKNYTILVDREKLSNNTNIKIIIDNKEVNFVFGKADVNVTSDTKNLNFKYELEDENSQVKVTGDKNLELGKNIVSFTVIAEDDTKVIYELTVNKDTENNETTNTMLGLIAIGGIGYWGYHFIQKRKKNS